MRSCVSKILLGLKLNDNQFFFHIFYNDVQNIDINVIFDIPPIFIPIYLIICSVVVIVNGLFYISSRGDVKRRKIYSSFKTGKLCECLLTIVSDTTSTRSLTFERWYSVSDWSFFGNFSHLNPSYAGSCILAGVPRDEIQ